MTVTDITAARPARAYDDRPLPHNIDAEHVVLGAILLDPATLTQISEIIAPLDLYRPAHQIIYELLLEMAAEGRPIDPIAVNNELGKRGLLTKVGGGPYLHTLTQAVPVTCNGGYYARIVADLADKRRLVEVGTRIAQLGYDGDGEVDDLKERASQALASAVAARGDDDGDTESIGDDSDFIDRLEKPLGDEGRIPFPYADLTEATSGGAKNGELVTVAGRTGAGKSVVGLDIARHAAIRLGLPTLYVSLEMPIPLVRERVYAAEAKVSLSAIKSHSLSDADWERIAKARPAINSAPLLVATPAKCTIALLRQRLQASLRRGTPARLLVVDHVGLMASTGRTESRYTEISSYARGLKLLAMEFDIPVVMLCQVNRAAGQRSDAIPRISDLRDSGELEQSSDLVVIVHREDYDVTDKSNPRAGEVDLYVAKNRSGPTCVITVSSQLHYTRFADMAQG